MKADLCCRRTLPVVDDMEGGNRDEDGNRANCENDALEPERKIKVVAIFGAEIEILGIRALVGSAKELHCAQCGSDLRRRSPRALKIGGADRRAIQRSPSPGQIRTMKYQ